MTLQTKIDFQPQEQDFKEFLNQTIQPQNNPESTDIMQSECGRFANQAMRLLDYLKSGGKINSGNANEKLQITDLRPRISALKRMGYKLDFDKLPGRLKDWYLVKENKDTVSTSV